MDKQLSLAKLRLSVWDLNTKRSEPILDGDHQVVADFLGVGALPLSPLLQGHAVTLPHTHLGNASHLDNLEVSAILSDLTYAFPAMRAAEWLEWYQTHVKPNLTGLTNNLDIWVTYPVPGTPIQRDD
jgi:hypothetical protein